MTHNEADKAIEQGRVMRKYYTACAHLRVPQLPTAPIAFERWFLSDAGCRLVTKAIMSAIPVKIGQGDDD